MQQCSGMSGHCDYVPCAGRQGGGAGRGAGDGQGGGGGGGSSWVNAAGTEARLEVEWGELLENSP